jgi:hypothetical protein
MRTPTDIVIEQKLDKTTGTAKFYVNAIDYVLGGFITFTRLADLAAWLDKHDYRYVWGSRGCWRLP